MRGKSYRRKMKVKKDNRLRKMITAGYIHHAGYIQYGWLDGVWTPIGDYIRYPKHSKMQRYLKKQTHRKIRRSENVFQGNSYRKCVEYRWEFY